MSNYDQAFIIKNLAVLPGAEVKAIPSNTEKLISFSIKVGRLYLRFLDSFRLMPESLSKLASNLPACEFKESANLVSPEHFALVTKKSFYPYDYVKSQDVFSELTLPPRQAFYNRLEDTELSVEDYAHAQSVWSALGMRDFGQYHDFYLKLDACLLMDVLQSFRAKCLTKMNVPSAKELADQGSIECASLGDSTKCVYCNVVLFRWEEGDSAAKDREYNSPTCKLIQFLRQCTEAESNNRKKARCTALGWSSDDAGIDTVDTARQSEYF